ncbi:MAG: CBS domain-containing protein [Pseudohongiellaceae bacterium]
MAEIAATDNPALALTFIRSYPAAAARLLEGQEAGQTAALINAVPIRQLDGLVPGMLPFYVGQVCAHLNPERAASLLGETDPSYIAAVLRNMPKQLQSRILGHLPKTRRSEALLLLNFNENEVGSRMTPHIVPLPEDSDVVSAREYIRKGELFDRSDRLFVVNRQRLLVGNVSYQALVQARKKDDFRKLINYSNDALLSRMTIQTAFQYPAWSGTDTMPVVNRNQQFVGAIRHVDLRSALEQLSRSTDSDTGDSPLAGLASAYGNTFLALFNTVEAVLTDSRDKGDK